MNKEPEVVDITKATLPYETPPDDGFDPRDHRDPPMPISNWMAYFNFIRTVFGAGLMTIPLAASQCGLIFGPILIICIGILLTYMHWTLIWCLNEIARQLKLNHISYRYGFRMALLHGPPILHGLGRAGPRLVAYLMVLAQLGICTVIVIFTADSLRDLLDWQRSESAIIALFFPYLFLEYFMKNLKIVSYISMIGLVVNAIGLTLVFIIAILNPDKEIYPVQISVLHLLYAIGLGYFNMACLGVTLSIDKALKDGRIMSKVITIGMSISTVVAAVFGALGTWAFGLMDENIMRLLPIDDTMSQIAIAFYLVSTAFTYPIQCFPGNQIILELIQIHNLNLKPTKRTAQILEQIIKPTFVIVTFLFAYMVPFQGPVVAFVGNLTTSILAVVFPCLMEIGILWPGRYGRYGWIFIKDVTLILIGLCSFTFGVILQIYIIYKRVLLKQSPVRNFLDSDGSPGFFE